MAKFRGGRAAFERNLRKRRSRAQRAARDFNKNVRTKKGQGKYKRRPRPPSHTVQAEGKVKLPKVEYKRLKVTKLRIRAGQEAKDENVVSSIAESFIVTGQVHPVIVRRVGSKLEVVWGSDVVAAALAAEIEFIECRFFEGNDDEAELLQTAEALFRQELTALEKAEGWAKWADGVLKTKGLFSGQPVPKRGRPEGALLKTARLLPAYGERTVEARKKMLGRAYKIARLSSDVKKAIMKASLDNNQSVLLAIAAVGGAEAQHRKLAELSKRLSEIPEVQSPPLQPTDAATDADDKDDNGRKESGSDAPGQNPPTKDDDDVEESADDDQDGEEADEDGENEVKDSPAAPPPDTDFKQLRQFWKKQGCGDLWAYTPMTVRKEFIDWIASRSCRANSDIKPYVEDVFAGRKQIEARVLRAHATSKGFSGNQITTYLMSNGYRREKSGSKVSSPWIYRNADWKYMSKQSSISNADLAAPYEANKRIKAEAESHRTATNLKQPKSADDYYDV